MKTSKTILVKKEVYFYLRNKYRKQKGYEPLTEEQLERIWQRMKREGSVKNETKQLDDLSFDWSVNDIIKILDDNNYEYKKGEDIEYMDITL